MMKFNTEEEDIFFDTEDSFLSEDLDFTNLSYGIWCNELKSVKERGADFLNRMGFFEDSCSVGETFNRNVTSETDRITECSGDTAESCCVLDLLVEDPFDCPQRETGENPCVSEQFLRDEAEVHIERCKNIDMDQKVKFWWKSFVDKMKSRKEEKPFQMKVEKKRKKCKELSALYTSQEICAHKGVIWTMKFSPDGQYLATGGEDGVLRVWGVTSTDASSITPNMDLHSHGLNGKSSHAPIIASLIHSKYAQYYPVCHYT